MKKAMIAVLVLSVITVAPVFGAVSSYTDLVPTNDAYTRQKTSEANKTFNNNELWVGTEGGNSIYSFLTFDLATIPQVDSAYLWLYNKAAESKTVNATAYTLNATWNESSLTWNNQPALVTSGATTALKAAGWYSWDISSFAKAAQGGTLSFAIAGTGDKTFKLVSSEATGGNNPYLRITPVVPEPISSALFLVGGTVLAVRQYRKKRKA